MKSNEDRPTAVITGASGTIGSAIARELAVRGYHAVLVARREEKLVALASAINESGGESTPLACDLTNEESLKELTSKLQERFGRLALLVNNAGKELLLPLPAMRARVARDLLDVNVVAVAELTRFCLGMLGGGAVVNVASVAALSGVAAMSLYSASKGAVISLSRSLAKELAPRKIRVNAVAPGMVKSEMMDRLFKGLSPEQIKDIEKAYPLGFGTPEDVARAVAFLGDKGSSWITGQVLVVDGGFSL